MERNYEKKKEKRKIPPARGGSNPGPLNPQFDGQPLEQPQI